MPNLTSRFVSYSGCTGGSYSWQLVVFGASVLRAPFAPNVYFTWFWRSSRAYSGLEVCFVVPWHPGVASRCLWFPGVALRFPWSPGAASRCSISFTGSCIVEPDRSPGPYWEELRPLQNPTRAPNCDQGLHCRTRLFTWTLFGSTWPGPIVQNPTQAQHCRTRPGPTVQNPT